MIATKWKWNEHTYNMKKFRRLDVGALVLWRAFGLIEISQTFCYENWQILMNESAFHFCGRLILTTTVFHIPKSTYVGGIADYFRVCINWKFPVISGENRVTNRVGTFFFSVRPCHDNFSIICSGCKNSGNF
jgi:hypothetical protein